ncbi:MAG: hypothetical protein QM758_13295 [Armatimonas sp.]
MTISRDSGLDILFLVLLTSGFALSVDAQIIDISGHGQTNGSVRAEPTSTSKAESGGTRVVLYEWSPRSGNSSGKSHDTTPVSLLASTSPRHPLFPIPAAPTLGKIDTGSNTVALSPSVISASGTGLIIPSHMPVARSVKEEQDLKVDLAACGGASFANLHDRLMASPTGHRGPAKEQSWASQPRSNRRKFSGEARPKLPAGLFFR